MRDRFLVLNSILSERITAAAAPLYQNIPCGNLTGYTVDIRVLPLASAAVCRVLVPPAPPSDTVLKANALHMMVQKGTTLRPSGRGKIAA